MGEYEVTVDLECECGKEHTFIVGVQDAQYVPMNSNNELQRATHILARVPYTCPCTNSEKTAEFEINRPEDRDIRNLSFSRWVKTGCGEV